MKMYYSLKMTLAIPSILFLLVISQPLFAADLIVENGQLMGANRVDVGGILYDVKFVDGVGIDIFRDGDNVWNIVLIKKENAKLAAQALLDQVLLGEFDNIPQKTNGIYSGRSHGQILTPFQFKVDAYTIGGSLAVVGTNNFGAAYPKVDGISSMGLIDMYTNTGSGRGSGYRVYGYWTLSKEEE